jgi:hypothetical protein
MKTEKNGGNLNSSMKSDSDWIAKLNLSQIIDIEKYEESFEDKEQNLRIINFE